MAKSKKFEDIFDSFHPPICIRKETLFSNGARKVVAFMVTGLDWAIKQSEGFDEKSDDIVAKEKESFNEGLVLYEWQNSDFYKVEDIKKQDWFKI